MQFIDLWAGTLSALAEFLMTDPVCDFIGLFILFGITRWFFMLTRGVDR